MISDDTRSGRTYHHNGDFSGEIRINVTDTEINSHTKPDGTAGYSVDIPFADLVDIVKAAFEQREAVMTVAVRYPIRDGRWRLAELGEDPDLPGWPKEQ
jgi:hypothetical protein